MAVYTNSITFIFFIIITCFKKLTFSLNTSSNLPTCEVKSNVDECLKAVLQNAIKYSSEGNNKFAIPPLDPYFIPKIEMTSNKNTPVNIEMRNSTTHGFKKAVVTKVKADPRSGIFQIQFKVPISTLISHYNLTGNVFSIPINGNGISNITLLDVSHDVSIQGHPVNNYETGHKQLVLNAVTLKLKPKKIMFKFDRLFKDNKELELLMNQMMNDNWEEIFTRIKPKMEHDITAHLRAILNNLFKLIPYDQVFPDL